MRIAVIGIDLGKTVCSLAALDESGALVKRRRLRRESIVAFSKDLPPCIIAMEACCGLTTSAVCSQPRATGCD